MASLIDASRAIGGDERGHERDRAEASELNDGH